MTTALDEGQRLLLTAAVSEHVCSDGTGVAGNRELGSVKLSSQSEMSVLFI